MAGKQDDRIFHGELVMLSESEVPKHLQNKNGGAVEVQQTVLFKYMFKKSLLSSRCSFSNSRAVRGGGLAGSLFVSVTL